MERNSRFIDLIIRARNNFSRGANEVREDINQLSQAQRRLNAEIDREEARVRLINDYQRLQPIIAEVRNELLRTTGEVRRQQTALRGNTEATEEQRAALERARLEQQDTRREYTRLSTEIRNVSRDLSRNSIAIGEFDTALDQSRATIAAKRRELVELDRRLESTGREATQAASRLDRLRDSMTRSIIVMNRLRSGAISVSVAFGALLGIGRLAQQFGDIEEGMTNVARVSSLSRDEIQSLTDELTVLSNTVSGSTVPELLNFATAAGRLGIDGSENLFEFTRIMDQLAISTNLVGEEGADSFGRLINALDIGSDEFQELASQIVAVGNNAATNEALITRFATRIANATREANFSNEIVVALAGSMAELGIQAESGGTQVGRVTRDLRTFASEGGPELQILADTIGLTAEEIQRLGEEDPGTLFTEFLRGLNSVSTGAGEATQTLIALGLNNERILQTIPPLAIGYENFAEQLALTTEQAREANAVSIEAARAFAAQNTVVDRFLNTVRNAGAVLSESFSDEYIRTLEDGADGVNRNTQLWRDIGQQVGTFIELLGAATTTAGNLFNNLNLGRGVGLVFDLIAASVNGVIIALEGLNFGVLSVRLAYERLTGDTEGFIETQELLLASSDRAADGVERFGNNLRSSVSIGIESFRDLELAAENTRAVDALSEFDRALFDSVIASGRAGGANADLEETYVRLTNEISRQDRILRIQTELQADSVDGLRAKQEQLDAAGVSQERINELLQTEINRNISSIETQSQLNDARVEAREIIGDSTSTVEELIAVLDRGNLSDEVQLELLRELHAARVLQLQDFEDNANAAQQATIAAEAQAQAIRDGISAYDGANDAVRVHIDEIIRLQEEQRRLGDELENGRISNEEYSESYIRLRDEIFELIEATGLEIDQLNLIIDALNDTHDAIEVVTTSTEDYISALLDNVRGNDDARLAIQSLNQQLEENERLYTSGERNINEYRETQRELDAALDLLNDTIQETTDEVNELTGAYADGTEATQAFVDQTLESVRGISGATDAFEILNERLEENQLAFERNEISLTERNEAERILRNGIQELSSVIDVQVNAVDDLDAASNRVVETNGRLTSSNRSLVDSNRSVTQSVVESTEAIVGFTERVAERNRVVREQFEELIELNSDFGENAFGFGETPDGGFGVVERDGGSFNLNTFDRDDDDEVESSTDDAIEEVTDAIVDAIENTDNSTTDSQEEREDRFTGFTPAEVQEIEDLDDNQVQIFSREDRNRDAALATFQDATDMQRTARTLNINISTGRTVEAIEIPNVTDEQERAIETLANRLGEMLR